jgi:hypothetical protein
MEICIARMLRESGIFFAVGASASVTSDQAHFCCSFFPSLVLALRKAYMRWMPRMRMSHQLER